MAQIATRRRTVMARTPMQDAYMRAFDRAELTFGIGPAGTGKTYLAVAYAAAMLERGAVDRVDPVAPGGRGRRAPRLPARRHAREGRSLSPPALRRALRHDALRQGRARLSDRHDRGGAACLHARPHARQCRRHPRRGAEHHVDADEDVPDPPRREFAHDRHRRSEPDRPAARSGVRPGRGGRAAHGTSPASRRCASPPPMSSAIRWSRASSRPTTPPERPPAEGI